MKKSRFPAPGEFTKTLHARVDAHFKANGKAVTGDYRIVTKSLILITVLISSYVTLFYLEVPLWLTIFAGFLLSQTKVLLGFNIMHDGNHGSYSSKKWVNRLTGSALDFIGGSSYLWKHKHNVLHHTYTNIDGVDSDLETEGFIRLSPRQKWKPVQRFQHIYALFLYSIITFHWFLFSDFKQAVSLKMGSSKIPKLKSGDIALFVAGKLFYYSYMIILPLMFQSWQFVLTAFIAIHLIAGVTLSVIFQLAHTLEVNEFPEGEQPGGYYDDEWSIHQLKTTANFARNNAFATWYMGGLNYQIEHHLFPKMSHVHYPDIAPLVKEVCREFNVRYTEYPTVLTAFRMHMRFLKALGKEPQTAL